VFTVDTGMCDVWAARHITPNGTRGVSGSFLLGTMADALPHAIGAELAYAGRQVISMSGAGGLGMLLGELLTVALHRLPVKIVLTGGVGRMLELARSNARNIPHPAVVR
jgi:pyruvate dehydrogenase (quinone)